jgi:5'-3' exonuclease
MNGIIHKCSRPPEGAVPASSSSSPPPVTLTEEQMVHEILVYLDVLVNAVQPQRVLYLAVDGAPRVGRARVGPTG